MIVAKADCLCANAYLGRGLETSHGLGQNLLLARSEGAVATSSLGRGGSGTVLGIIRFACHVDKMQREKRRGQDNLTSKTFGFCNTVLLVV